VVSDTTPSVSGPTGATGGGSSGFGSTFKNPMVDVALAGLGLDVLKGNQNPAGYSQLAATAANDAAQGKLLEGYLQSGTLPPGLQATVNTASDAAKASIRAMYAQRGMSGSSAEAQDLEAAGMRTQAQAAQIATQLFQEGLNESQMGTQIYEILMNEQIAQDNALSTGISNLVGAMASASRPLAA
jgi:hypothetical protein